MRLRLIPTLAVASTIVYLVVRLVGVEDFPIYFFCDEAYIGNQIEALLKNNFHDSSGRFLPLYYEKAPGRWVPQISLYLYLPFVLIGGTTITSLRWATAFISLSGILALYRFASDHLRLKQSWLVIPVIGLLPVWILHSRTAFETALIIPFLSLFLLFVARWFARYRDALFGLPISAALLFYSHFSGSVALVATSAVIILCHPKRILSQWRWVFVGGFVFSLLMIPFLLFSGQSPGAMKEQLTLIQSVWYQGDATLSNKLMLAVESYLSSFSPEYWFSPEGGRRYDATRHLWGGRGYLEWWIAPFLIHGFFVSASRIRDYSYRLIIILCFTASAASLLVPIMIMRVFAEIVPVALLAAVSLDRLLTLLQRRSKFSLQATVLVALILNGYQLFLLREALVGAPNWFRDYGLYGIAWGAKELHNELVPQLAQNFSNHQILLTSSWANGSDSFPPFFIKDEEVLRRFRIVTVGDYTDHLMEIHDTTIAIVTADEWKEIRSNPKLAVSEPIATLPYPDGAPGFIAAHFSYSTNAPAIFAAELAERQKLVDDRISIAPWGAATVRHSKFDIGSAGDLFDGDPMTVVRTFAGVNPLQLQITFDTPSSINRLSGIFWPMTGSWKIFLKDDTGRVCAEKSGNETNTGGDMTLLLSLDGCQAVKTIELTVTEESRSSTSRVHAKSLDFGG